MICKSCRNSVSDDATSCPVCGAAVVKTEVKEEKIKEVRVDNSGEKEVNQSAGGNTSSSRIVNEYQPPELFSEEDKVKISSSFKKIRKFVFAVVIFTFIAFCIFFLLNR